MLAGQTPFRGDSLDEVLENVKNGIFPSPREIRPEVPQALESICLRAMRTRPDERYQSPRELAEEMERYLADEAIQAHIDPFVIRARRWARKHPRIVSTVSASLIVGLVSAVTIASIISVKNDELRTTNLKLDSSNSELKTTNEKLATANSKLDERNLELKSTNTKLASTNAKLDERNLELKTANAKLVQANAAEAKAKGIAESRRKEAEAVLAFFKDKVLAAARPKDLEGGLGIDATIRAAIDRAESQTSEAFHEQPLVEAEIRRTIGTTYDYLGEAALAIKQRNRALSLFQQELGEDAPSTLTAISDLALSKHDSGDFEASRKDLEWALAKATDALGAKAPLTMQIKGSLGGVYGSLTQFEKAIKTLTEVYEAQKAMPESRKALVPILLNLGSVYTESLKLEKAVEVLKEAYAICRKQRGSNDPVTWRVMNNLAAAYTLLNKHRLAIPLMTPLLKLRRERLGNEHPETVATINNLAVAYTSQGRHRSAQPLLKEALDIRLAKGLGKHPDTLSIMDNLGIAYRKMFRYKDAIKWHKQALDGRREVLPKHHRDILLSMNNLALAYSEGSRPNDAEPLLTEVIPLMTAKLGDKNPDLLTAVNNLGTIYTARGQFGKAVPLLEKNLEILKKTLPADDPRIVGAMENLGDAYWKASRHEESLKIRKQALDHHKAKDPDSLATLNSMTRLGASCFTAGKQKEAVRLLDDALEKHKAKFGVGNLYTVSCLNTLGSVHTKLGNTKKAIEVLSLAFTEVQKKLPNGASAVEVTASNLGLALVKDGQSAQGLPLLDRYIAHRRKLSGFDQAGFSNLLIKTAFDLLDSNAPVAAEKYLREALVIGQKRFKDHPATHNNNGLIGQAILNQAKKLQEKDRDAAEKKFAEAENTLWKATAVSIRI